MKLRALLASLLVFSSSLGQEPPIYETIKELQRLERRFTVLEFGELELDLRKQRATYPLGRSTLYFDVKEGNYGEPLYLVKYNFYLEDVPSFIKGLRRTAWGRADKKAESYSGKYEDNPSASRHRLRNWNIH